MNYLWNILIPDGSFEFLSLLALAAVKATLLLAFVALIILAFRRISAATRHLLWTSALCAALVLPFLSFLTFWEVPVLPAALSEDVFVSNESGKSDETLKTPETPPVLRELSIFDQGSGGELKESEIQTKVQSLENFSTVMETSGRQISPGENAVSFFPPQTVNWALAVWIAGASLLLFRLFMGLAASDFLVRRGREFNDAKLNELFSTLCSEIKLKNKTLLRCSERTTMPIVCGVFRPVVLLPAGAEEWSEQRQRMVLLHELAHVARRDCLTQMLAQTACAFYWFNPFVWIAARRLRVERERACDDRVLSLGTKPSEYAHHLLEIARSMQEERSIFEWRQTTSVAMARRSQLEGRLLAILREEKKFGAMSRAATAGLAALMCFLLVSLAVVRPTAINAQKSSVSETTSNNRQDVTAAALPDSLSVIGSERENDTTNQNAETDETTSKQDEFDVLDKSSEPGNNDERIDRNDEQKMPPPVKNNPEQIISEAIQKQIAALPQKPESLPPLMPETTAFINAEYQQKPQTQDKSGDFIDEMASVGFTNLSVDELIRLKTHRVTADFVSGLRAFGFNNLTPKTITNLRIYNVTPAYIEAMAAAGYKGLTLKDLTSARIYKVTPEYAKAIREAGYPSLSIGQTINFKIYNVTPELVRSARNRLGDLTPKQMISLKISGVLNRVEDKKKDTK